METTVVETLNTAAPAAAQQNDIWGMVIYCAVILAVIYFLMIRPNKKRMAEYQKMLAGLKVGSKVLCAGGIYGTVKKIEDGRLDVEIAKGVVIEVAKNSVANIEK